MSGAGRVPIKLRSGWGEDPDAEQKVVLYEVNEKATAIEDEIDKILQLAENSKGEKRLELLIDGSVFAKMLTSNGETLKRLN